jgi:hypothetical protein
MNHLSFILFFLLFFLHPIKFELVTFRLRHKFLTSNARNYTFIS